MKKSVLVSILLALSLVACSSKPVKETAAPVVDKNVSAPMDDSAKTSGMNDSDSSMNPLKDPNNILSQRSVYFDFDKDEVKSEFRPLVEAHAKYLLAHADAKVILQGNTDDRGSSEYNLSLGQRRAVAVKKVLNLLGVQDKQIETVSYGKEKPVATGDDEASRGKNRRADIVYQGE
ncbi:peptidoglycan-associated lipoprotein Pal [Methyloradius palustris]|uniref:Peptidoglycan-associated lipoprotein n=1 Tax=Methyloradius palustris TaxID=2778876 RepID=A0A8D5G114_9PROT|nr:peptidoglycan-associated lipoprotein Pal [Methyloradius palustris]BCM25984.1 peptidoglycan-associated lipoprotein [Methyloradius palustris]